MTKAKRTRGHTVWISAMGSSPHLSLLGFGLMFSDGRDMQLSLHHNPIFIGDGLTLRIRPGATPTAPFIIELVRVLPQESLIRRLLRQARFR